MNFDDMNPIQRRLHNAACVLGADGDEYGFEQLQRDAIAEIERLRERLAKASAAFEREQNRADAAEIAAETAAATERERCAKLCDEKARECMELARLCGGDDGNEVCRAHMATELAEEIRSQA